RKNCPPEMPAAARICATDAARTPRSAKTTAAAGRNRARALASPSCTPEGRGAGARGPFRTYDRGRTCAVCRAARAASCADRKNIRLDRWYTRCLPSLGDLTMRRPRDLRRRLVLAPPVGFLAVALIVGALAGGARWTALRTGAGPPPSSRPAAARQ